MNAVKNLNPVHANCLQQSLTLWWLLRRIGIANDLRIDVDSQIAIFRAQAWFGKDGSVLNDSPNSVLYFVTFDQAFIPAMLDTL